MTNLELVGEITCDHTYITTGKNDLKLVATTATKQLLQREEIWIRYTLNSIEVYTKKENLDTMEPINLLFWIEVTTPQFYTYTQIPEGLINKDQILFFDTQTDETFVMVKKNRIKEVQRKLQVVVFDQEVEKNEQIKIKNHHNAIVHEELVLAGSKSIVLDLSYEEDGLYTWEFNGFSGTFFLTDKNLKQTIGVCMLTIKPEKVHRINLRFETKKTYWEYLFISKKNTEEVKYEIIDTKGAYTFTNHGEVSILGTKAISYISDQEIPYSKHSQAIFKLVATDDNAIRYQIIEDRILPNANPENIKKHHRTEKTAFKTQTIVYI